MSLSQVAPQNPKFVVQALDCGANNKALNLGVQEMKKKSPDTAVMLFSAVDDAVVCLVSVPKGVNKDSGLSAIKFVPCNCAFFSNSVLTHVIHRRWLEAVIPLIGGKSGGKDLVAQTRGDVPAKTDEAIAVAVKYVTEILGA